MRVAIVAESFLPNVNGVTNSVLRVLEHLKATGHEAMVIAPDAMPGQEAVDNYLGFPVHRVPAVKVPLINSLPIGLPRPSVTRALKEFNPDVVHLASPFVLGATGAFAARRLKVPAIAVYQTDVAGFALSYHLSSLAEAAWAWTRYLHNMCARTLAPSSAAIAELLDNGVRNVYKWGRGVDAERFHPRKRSQPLRSLWAPEGQTIVGYVGRLASEKKVERLAPLAARDDIQVVIVGDGPERARLQELMPTAIFTGGMYGEDLPRAYASFDVFVHAGVHETFCQAVQESLASGVPVIGPNAGGPRDLVRPGVDGFLLEPDTFEEQLSATVDAIVSHGNYESFVQAARAGISTKTWPAICSQLMDHYYDVTATAAAEQELRRTA